MRRYAMLTAVALTAACLGLGGAVGVASPPSYLTLRAVGDEPNAAGTATWDLGLYLPDLTEVKIHVSCTGLTRGKTYVAVVEGVGPSKPSVAKSGGRLEIRDSVTCRGWIMPFGVSVVRIDENGYGTLVLRGP